jgi:membrane protein implicated in regulation of membrane protease activity
MGFFSTQPLSGGTSEMLIVSPDFWIFWAVSAPLTVITLALWWWWNQRRLRKDGNDTSGKAVVREV